MSLPHPSTLLPHAGSMRWIDAVRSHDGAHTVCEAHPGPDHPLAADGRVHGLAAVEWIAQAAAVHAGLQGSGPPRPGVVTGCRRLELPPDGFALAPVQIEVRPLDGGADTLAVFEGTVSQGGAVCARGEVTVLRGVDLPP